MDSTIVAQAQALIAAHPLASVAFSAVGGAGLWHGALAWIEAHGLSLVDTLTARARAKQRLAAKRLGFTDEEILAAEKKEAAAAVEVAQRIAADLNKP